MEPAAKAQLRRAFSAARQARDADEIERARTDVATIVLQRCARDGWACVAAYLPLRTEPGSLALLVQCLNLSCNLLNVGCCRIQCHTV